MHIQSFFYFLFSKKNLKTSILFGLLFITNTYTYIHARSNLNIGSINDQPAAVDKQLIWAIQDNNLQKVIALVRDQKNINNQDFLGYSPLHYAAKYAKKSIVACLIEAKALLNQVSVRNGNTPLLLAIRRGHKNIVSLLLASGANPNIVNHKGYHPLHLAIQQNRKDLVELLLEAGATCSTMPSPLLMAIKQRSLPIVQRLLQHNQVVETQDKKGYTELHWTAKQNLLAIFQILLKSGRFNINAKAANGVTPLHFIVANKKTKLLKAILHVPALTVNVQDSTGSTPLHYAVVANQLKAVSALLRYPCIDVNKQNNRGQTALHYAVQYQHVDIVKKLLLYVGKGARIKNKEGVTPLELAMSQQNGKIYQLILAHVSLLGVD
ncbi:ankyrin repeat domain-containing protein [Candidatus Cardinium sp. cByotN1]|uniref:ankyrin repeat domain-containing protein n=1 Tax=Candidatus Cardinium sp. cByotN1 TaxID=2699439 RepID=UPI001FB1FF65|nr:ankyrin repeat domain-containing protein [Candidatus Cardinium sp. cByotN1]